MKFNIMHFNPSLFFFIVSIFSILGLSAQTIKVTGIIYDKSTGEKLMFASVGLKNHMTGTISNKEGEFELTIPAEQQKDTLMVSFLGYNSYSVPLPGIRGRHKIEMEKSAFALQEVVVRVLSPTDYIKLAMKRAKDNYPAAPFQTQSYYREQLLENRNFVNFQEGVFLSFFPSYQDTLPNQHQLLLYHSVDDPVKLEFMRDWREKKKAKNIKKSEKKGETREGKKALEGICVNLRNNDFYILL